MGQDKYTKFVLTVIAFSLFWIALNVSVLEFFLYDFYDGEMKNLFTEISIQTTEVFSRIDEISSRTDDVIDAIKKR